MSLGAEFALPELSWATESELAEMVKAGLEGAVEELARRYRLSLVRDLETLCGHGREIPRAEAIPDLAQTAKLLQPGSSLFDWLCLLSMKGILLGQQ